MVVFKMRDSVPSARYSSVCNVLRLWSILLIPTYRVYRLYDTTVYTAWIYFPTKKLTPKCTYTAIASHCPRHYVGGHALVLIYSAWAKHYPVTLSLWGKANEQACISPNIPNVLHLSAFYRAAFPWLYTIPTIKLHVQYMTVKGI